MKRTAKTALWIATAAALTTAGVARLDAKPDVTTAVAAPKADAPAGKTVPINLALDAKATASSYQNDGLKAEFAVDGDNGSRWCAENGTVPQWLAVDLGKPQDLAGCKIVWEAPVAKYAYRIDGSPDGKAWTPIVDHGNRLQGILPDGDAFSAKGVRHVRLTVTATTPGAWASVKEFKVFGTQMVPAGSQKPKRAKKDEFSAASVKAPAGWDVTLFAAPPDVQYCTTVCATPGGDVYVGIDEQGSLGREKGRGRIVRCRDTDGDGKADQFVTCAKMDNPRGVWVDGEDLYVLFPPFLAKYKLGPDGVAVGEPDVLAKGITAEETKNGRGADHTTNGFRVGVDGWAYVAMGDFGVTHAVGKDGATLKMHGGGVVRVRLDGTGLEDYSFGQRNIYDVAIDPFMNVFTRDNTNDGGGWNDRLSQVVPTGNYGYPRLFQRFAGEFVDCLADYGGGSPCGALWVDEPGMPAVASGLLTVEWGASKVYHHPLAAKGAGYETGVKQEVFLDLRQPTDIDYDGRGNFFVCTWTNGGFAYSGPNVGYLARVAPKGFKAAAFPDVAKETDDRLVAMLVSDSMKVREAVQREILRRGEKPGTADRLAAVAAMTVQGEATPAIVKGRVAAAYTLKRLIGAKADATLASLAQSDRDVEVRVAALRVLSDKKGDEGASLRPFLDGLKDENPRVRLTAAWGVGRLGGGKAGAIGALVPLLGDDDFLVRHVSINALVALNAGQACVAAVDPANPKVAAGALLAAQQIFDVKVIDALAAKLPTLTDPTLRAGVYRALCRLHDREADWAGQWWGTRPDTSGPYFTSAPWAGTPKANDQLEVGLRTEKGEALKALIVDMERHKIVSSTAQAMMADAIKRGDPAFRDLAVERMAAIPVGSPRALTDDEAKLCRDTVVDPKVATDLRVKAFRAMTRNALHDAGLETTATTMAAVSAAGKEPAELTALFDEVTRDAKYAAAVPYFSKLAATTEDAALREVAYAFLLGVADGKLTQGPAKAAAAKAIEAGWEKPKTAASLLRAVGRAKASDHREMVEAMATDANPDVVRAAAYAADRLGLKKAGVAAESREPIEKVGFDKTVQLVLKEKGEPAVGKELFAKVGCVGCHTVSPAEPPKGPFLGGISTRYGRAELCESIMKPNAKIAQGFETQWFKNKDEDVIEGFVTREAGNEIELRNAAGVATVLKTADVVKRGKRETSIMPEGLVGKLTPAELASLVSYLETLKAK